MPAGNGPVPQALKVLIVEDDPLVAASTRDRGCEKRDRKETPG
jgi:hypothetical protein